MKIFQIFESDKLKVLKSTGLAFVQFTTKLSTNCQIVEPIMKKISKENPEISFIKIDVIKSSEWISSELGDSFNLPHFRLYDNGEMICEFYGSDIEKIKNGVEILKSRPESIESQGLFSPNVKKRPFLFSCF